MDRPDWTVDWWLLETFFTSVGRHLDNVPEGDRREEVLAIGKKVRERLLETLDREFA
jgi:hypothetical protein